MGFANYLIIRFEHAFCVMCRDLHVSGADLCLSYDHASLKGGRAHLMHSVHYDPPRARQKCTEALGKVEAINIRAWQKCTETLGKVDAIDIETKEGGPPPLGGSECTECISGRFFIVSFVPLA